jgi:hypothetical protein
MKDLEARFDGVKKEEKPHLRDLRSQCVHLQSRRVGLHEFEGRVDAENGGGRCRIQDYEMDMYLESYTLTRITICPSSTLATRPAPFRPLSFAVPCLGMY